MPPLNILKKLEAVLKYSAPSTPPAGSDAAVGITINGPVEIKLFEVVMFPVALSELSVPTEVMLGCALVVTVAAVVAAPDMLTVYDPDNLALGTVPVSKLVALSDVNARPLPVTAPAVTKLPPVTLPVTLNALNVPTLVILV